MAIYLSARYGHKSGVFTYLTAIKNNVVHPSLHVPKGGSKRYAVQYVFEHVHLSKYKVYGSIGSQLGSRADGLHTYTPFPEEVNFESFIF